MPEKETISRKDSATNLNDDEDNSKCAGCKRNCKAFTQREWVYIILIFTTFYLFMTAWMAIHISAMVSMLPDRNTWNHNGCQLGDARNRRFYVDGLTVAKDDFPDCQKNLANATLLANPWEADDVGSLTDRDIACPYSRPWREANWGNRSCAPKQQLRVVNQYENRILPADIQVWCELENHEELRAKKIASIEFTNFVDPRSLGDPAVYSGRRVEGDCHTAPAGQGCTYDSTFRFEQAWTNNVPVYEHADLLAGDHVKITWLRGYTTPIIVDFDVELTLQDQEFGSTYNAELDVVELEFKCRTTNKVDETYFFGRGGDPLAKPINGEREIDFQYNYYFCPENGDHGILNPHCRDLHGYNDCKADFSESFMTADQADPLEGY